MGYFVVFISAVMLMIAGINYHAGYDNNFDVTRKMDKLIGGKSELANKGLIQNNKLVLDKDQNQIFYIENQSNLDIKSETPDGYSNVLISFINTKNIGKQFETLQKGVDYKIYKCSNADCRFEKNNDFIIYEVVNKSDNIKKINEILLSAIRMQKIELDLLKYDSSNHVVYNVGLIYIIQTGDNNIKFPTIELKKNEKLFIKVKILDEAYNV